MSDSIKKGEAKAPFLEDAPKDILPKVKDAPQVKGPKPEELPSGIQPLPQDEEKHALVELTDVVILNGRKYGPGKCRIPEAAFDVFKNVLKR